MKYLLLFTGILFSVLLNAQGSFEIYALKYAVLKAPTPVSTG